MADEKTPQQQVQQTPAAPKYPRDELLANAEALFSVKPEVVLGALHGNSQQEFAVEELRKLIDDFLKRQVK